MIKRIEFIRGSGSSLYGTNDKMFTVKHSREMASESASNEKSARYVDDVNHHLYPLPLNMQAASTQVL